MNCRSILFLRSSLQFLYYGMSPLLNRTLYTSLDAPLPIIFSSFNNLTILETLKSHLENHLQLEILETFFEFFNFQYFKISSTTTEINTTADNNVMGKKIPTCHLILQTSLRRSNCSKMLIL